MKYPGFTAIELLITLFIAAMALAAGYQLYSTVLAQDAQTRLETEAGSVAYAYVKRYSGNVTAPCTPSAINQSVPINSNINGAMTIRIDCPNNALQKLSRVTVVIAYGTPEKTVTHSAYASAGGI